MRKMSEFIREIDDAPTLPFFVRSFAKAASGGKSASEDDEDDDDEDDEDDDEHARHERSVAARLAEEAR